MLINVEICPAFSRDRQLERKVSVIQPRWDTQQSLASSLCLSSSTSSLPVTPGCFITLSSTYRRFCTPSRAFIHFLRLRSLRFFRTFSRRASFFFFSRKLTLRSGNHWRGWIRLPTPTKFFHQCQIRSRFLRNSSRFFVSARNLQERSIR